MLDKVYPNGWQRHITADVFMVDGSLENIMYTPPKCSECGKHKAEPILGFNRVIEMKCEAGEEL